MTCFESRFETADTRDTIEVLIVAVNRMWKSLPSRVRNAQTMHEVQVRAAVELKCFQHSIPVIETQPAAGDYGSKAHGNFFSR